MIIKKNGLNIIKNSQEEKEKPNLVIIGIVCQWQIIP